MKNIPFFSKLLLLPRFSVSCFVKLNIFDHFDAKASPWAWTFAQLWTYSSISSSNFLKQISKNKQNVTLKSIYLCEVHKQIFNHTSSVGSAIICTFTKHVYYIDDLFTEKMLLHYVWKIKDSEDLKTEQVLLNFHNVLSVPDHLFHLIHNMLTIDCILFWRYCQVCFSNILSQKLFLLKTNDFFKYSGFIKCLCFWVAKNYEIQKINFSLKWNGNSYWLHNFTGV